METPNPLVFAFPLFLLAIGWEVYLSRKRKLNLYNFHDSLANFGIGIGDVVFGLGSTFLYLGVFFLLYNTYADIRYRYLGYYSLDWKWWVWILCIAADDLSFYWYHRFSHRIRLLWAAHVVHHSSEQFNFSVGLRNGWFSILYKPLFWYWMAFLGFHPIMISTCMSINAAYQFFCHTQLGKSWGWLELIVLSPRIHSVHHGKNPAFIDKNYAGIFVLYDRIFGTFRALGPSETVSFGVTHPPPSHKLVDIIFHEYRRLHKDLSVAKNGWDKLHYLFGPPEWKPRGEKPPD